MKKSINQRLEKLRVKWSLESGVQVLAILMVFSLAGSTVVAIRPLFFNLIGIEAQTPFLLKAIAYMLFIFPAYQLLLFGYGWMLGQHAFFVQKAKRLWAMIYSTNNN